MRSDAYAEAAFAINESGDVIRSQESSRPSLLIVRTGRIFTAHALNLLMLCDMNEYRRIHGCSSK